MQRSQKLKGNMEAIFSKRTHSSNPPTKLNEIPRFWKVVAAIIFVAGALLLASSPLLHNLSVVDLSLRNILLIGGGIAVGVSALMALFFLCFPKKGTTSAPATSPATTGEVTSQTTSSLAPSSSRAPAAGRKGASIEPQNQTHSASKAALVKDKATHQIKYSIAALLFALSSSENHPDDLALLEKIEADSKEVYEVLKKLYKTDQARFQDLHSAAEPWEYDQMSQLNKAMLQSLCSGKVTGYSHYPFPLPNPYLGLPGGPDPIPNPYRKDGNGPENRFTYFNPDAKTALEAGIVMFLQSDANGALLSISGIVVGLRKVKGSVECFVSAENRIQKCQTGDALVDALNSLLPQVDLSVVLAMKLDMYLYNIGIYEDVDRVLEPASSTKMLGGLQQAYSNEN